MIEPFTIPVEDLLPFMIVLAISPSGHVGGRWRGRRHALQIPCRSLRSA